MDELEALQAESKTLVTEFTTLGEKLANSEHEATNDERSRFDELDVKIKANHDQIGVLRSKMESDSEKASRLNRLKEVKEAAAKIEEYNYRRPNEESDFRGADQDRDLGIAMAAWGRFGCSDGGSSATTEEVQAGKRLGVNIAGGSFKISNPDVLRSNARHLQTFYKKAKAEGRTMATVVSEDDYMAADTDALDSRVPERAGYLNRPPEFLNTLESNMLAYGGILQAPITVMVTDHYEDVIQDYGDDTTHTGRQIGEVSTIGTTLTPAFGRLTWKAYDFTSDDVPTSNRQLERSRFGLPSFIAEMLGIRLGRVQGTSFTTGTGANTCQGILTATTAGGQNVSTAASLVIAYADLVDLESKLDPLFWRMAPEVGFMAHPKVLPLLRKIVTGTGEAKLALGEETGDRNLLFGRRIYWNNAMTAPVAGAWTAADKAMIFGDFSRFVVRRAGGGMPELIRDETTNRRTRGTIFTALIAIDSLMRNYGAAPTAELRITA